ncbi:hypothetical protein Tco_1531587, partial [Tanacetum coccineum]
LTASRPDIQFSTCLCARYQANPKESYLIAVKRIFRYLKGTPSLGLWYLKCSSFDLKGYSDSDYARCNMDRKSTSDACQFLEANLSAGVLRSSNLDHILKGDIKLHFIPTQYQLADIFTKPLDEPTFKRLIVELACLSEVTEQSDTSHSWICRIKYGFVAFAGAMALKPNQPKGPPFTDHIKAICNIDVPVESQALTTSYKTKMKVPQGKKPRARSGLKRKQSSKHTSESNTEASNSKTGQSDKETRSSSAKDKSLSHPSVSTPVAAEMHKETQQAAGGPTSLGATSEEGARPQLRVDYSTDSIAEADPGISTHNDSIPEQQDKTKYARDGLKNHTDLGTSEESRSDEISKKIKLEDLSNLIQDTRSAFLTLDSPQDEPIIILNESEEEETKRYEDTHATYYDGPKDTSIPHPLSPKSVQIQELMAHVLLLQSQKLKLEQQKEKAEAEVAFLKAQSLYPDVNQLTELLLKRHVRDMKTKLHGDLKEIPKKLETFTSTISSLTSQVAELKTFQWELPAEFLGLPSQISSIQEKLKTLDALPCILNKITDTLNRFATSMENASSKATEKSVPSVGQGNASPAEGEKNTNDADNANLKQQTTTTTPPTTSSFYSPLFPKSKGKKVMSSKDAEEEEDTESDSEDDHANPADSMVESSRKNKLYKFSFVTEGGQQIHLTAEKIEEQKRIGESLKAKLAKQEVERRKISKITNYDVLTKKGRITLKVYREDRTNEVISNFKASLCKELQFSLVDNSKLNVVYLLNKSLKLCFTSRRFTRREKRLLYIKRNKAISLGMTTSKVGIEVQQLSLKDCTWLPKKWLSFYQSLRDTNHVKDSKLASLFGKLKYKENLINIIYETEKEKTLVSSTPLLIAFFSTSIVQDFQDSPDDEEDTRRSQEYLNDLEEEYQARALLAKSKSFSQHKPELRPTKDFEAKYNKVKAKLALLKPQQLRTKVLSLKPMNGMKKKYHQMTMRWWSKEKKSLGTELKELTAITETWLNNSNKVNEYISERPWLSEAKGFILPNHDTADESSVCSTTLPPLKKLDGAKPILRPKTIKSILRSKSAFKAETLKGVIINEPSLALAKGNKSSSALKINSALAWKLKSANIKDDPPLVIVMKELNN